jgi:branched-subunit amino acid permease
MVQSLAGKIVICKSLTTACGLIMQFLLSGVVSEHQGLEREELVHINLVFSALVSNMFQNWVTRHSRCILCNFHGIIQHSELDQDGRFEGVQ